MIIKEYGSQNREKIVAIHPMLLNGEEMLKLLDPFKDNYCIIYPDLASHGDAIEEEYTSVEDEAKILNKYLQEKNYTDIKLLFGMSLGARLCLELIKNPQVNYQAIVLDGVPMFKDAKILRFLLNIFFVKKVKKAKTNPELAYKKLTKLFQDKGKIMAEHMIKLSPQSMKNINKDCTTFDFPSYYPELQKKLFIQFGSKELDAKQSKFIKKKYPQINLTLHPNYQHCQYLAQNREKYLEELGDCIKNAT